MRKFKVIALSMAAVVLLGSTGIAFAQPGYHNADSNINHKGWNGPATELTQEQITQLEQAREKHQSAVEPLRQELIVKHAELQSQMIAQKPDTGKVESLNKEIGEIKGKLASENIKFRAELEKQGLPTKHMSQGFGGMGMMGQGYGCKGGSGYGHKGFGHGGYDGPSYNEHAGESHH